MNFNIRRLKIQLACKHRELRTATPNTIARIQRELYALEKALQIAIQNRADQRRAA